MKPTILQRLQHLQFPIDNRGAANRLSLSLDHATNIMRLARDAEWITLEAHGLYWPTDKLKVRWRE